ncbi:MAG: AAA family ATPase, partial [Candidatus Micrarchaeota archaeon]
MRLIITGTPGTGKTVLAKAIAARTNSIHIDVNQLITKNKSFTKRKGVREKIVDLKALRRLLLPLLKRKDVVLDSHLLCEIPLPCDSVIVLRCDPRVLKKRLAARKYNKKKLNENLLCEYLDYCLVRSLENYAAKKVVQIDNTKPLTPAKIMAQRTAKVNWIKGREK